jgi:hypothetical protein
MDKNKIDIQTVYEMFEELNKKLDKRTDRPAEPTMPVVDTTAINAVTERLENVIEEMKKPSTVEHQHRHTIDIASNWFFLSWVVLVTVILGLFGTVLDNCQPTTNYQPIQRQ